MQIIFVTLIYFLIGGSCIYLLLCVDSNDPGILGKMNRLVFSICPDIFKFYKKKCDFLHLKIKENGDLAFSERGL